MKASTSMSLAAWVGWGLAMVLFVFSCSRPTRHDTGGAPEAHVTGPEGRLHVDDGGTGGLPVVFVHSFGGSSAHWSAQLAHLRPTRRAVAFDLRGHGRSDPPRSGTYAVNALADDIGAVVDGLGLKRFVLVGHSLGGAAAIAYAGAHPDHVASLVLVGTPGQSSPEQASRVMTSMQADYDKVSDGYWKTLLTGAEPNVETQIRSEMKRLPREAALRSSARSSRTTRCRLCAPTRGRSSWWTRPTARGRSRSTTRRPRSHAS
jgi:pimeloyl-ACP methyl ester carboxylesterase